MRFPRLTFACLLALFPPALAAAQVPGSVAGPPQAGVALQTRPPLAHGVASFPHVAGDGPAAERINRSLATVEDDLRGAIAGCAVQGRDNKTSSGWTRTVAVTSSGPRFLSFVANDLSYCGGPYPNAERLALVYDLHSGLPVDWLRLLPARFAARGTVSEGLAGSRVGLVTSQMLMQLYRQLYPARVEDTDPSMRETCRDSVEDGFTLWPDAAAHALMIQPTAQNHAAAACAVPVALTVPVLQGAGAAAPLLEVLGARP